VLNCATFSTPTRHTFRCQFIQSNQYDSFLFLISEAKQSRVLPPRTRRFYRASSAHANSRAPL
jgi:hypothetical protein